MTVPSKTRDRVGKILARARHPSTPVAEAHTAFTMAHQIADDAGIPLYGGSDAAAAARREADLTQTILRASEAMTRLTVRLAAAEARAVEAVACATAAETRATKAEANALRLQEELDASQRALHAAHTSADGEGPGDTLVPWDDFDARAEAIYGRTGWLPSFAHALKIPVAVLCAWRRVGMIPAHLSARLDGLTAEDRAPASRKRWSTADLSTLKALVREGLSDLEAASRLCVTFGRRIFETAVARQRRALASMSDAFAMTGARQTVERSSGQRAAVA